MGKISVCMATYNGRSYIQEQIASILPQLSYNDELVISDDSSTDDTVSLILDINDPRIVLLENNKYRSPVLNFENALIHSSGIYVFLADQDDLWHPNKISILLPLLHLHDLVLSDCKIIDDDDNIINPSFYALRRSGPGIFKNLYKNSYLGCCMAFRRSLLDKALPFPETIPMHDMWLGMVAEIYGTTFFCKEKLVYYRRHSSNASPTGGKSCYKALDMIKFRYKLLTALAKRYLHDK